MHETVLRPSRDLRTFGVCGVGRRERAQQDAERGAALRSGSPFCIRLFRETFRTASHVQVADLSGVGFDEFPPGLHLVPHEDAEVLVHRDGVVDLDAFHDA